MTWLVAGAARATIGTRSNQEDAFEIWPSEAEVATSRGDGVLAVVADGMGGHAGGEIAGDLAARTFVSTFTGSNGALSERLQHSLDAGNDAIASHVQYNVKLRGMGCTLVAAWIDRAGLSWVSVGDSLLLLFRAPDVLRLNDDHSLGAYLDDQVRRKQIVPAEAKNNPYRNALRSALTGKALDLVDLHGEPYKLAAGDWVILASDGIMTLEGDEIGDIVYANREESPEVMAERLIAAVEEKQEPDQDNTTVVVLRIDEDPDASLAEEQPTRVLRPELEEAEEGVATTQRIVQPPAIYSMFRRHRSLIVGLGMGIMFLIGWGVRALLG